jgi:hypothetical protein
VRWILDDGPLDALASLPDLTTVSLYPAGSLCVAPATAESARQSESRTRLLDIAAANGGLLFDRPQIFLTDDDPVGAVYLDLRGEGSPLGPAECDAIAWASVHVEDAVVVMEDKRAAFMALAELGRSRVAHPFDLWIELLESGAVSTADFEHLCERSRRKDRDLLRRAWPERIRRRLSLRLPDSGE